jgi:FkbM family methyltransferase
MPRVKHVVSAALLMFGYSINSKSKRVLLKELANQGMTVGQIRKIARNSKSQVGQDLMALLASGSKSGGFFVEFGAGDGVGLSNTLLLEKQFGWSGVLCEPARDWHAALVKNRSCRIDLRCVYSRTGEFVSFSENYLGELSGITEFAGATQAGLLNKNIASYDVETISLLGLLDEYQAPRHVDFLSMDTEGSEYEILRDFDFSRYSFGAISVEHNYSPNRQMVRDLLLANGYRQVFPDLSDFDDWFVHAKSPIS